MTSLHRPSSAHALLRVLAPVALGAALLATGCSGGGGGGGSAGGGEPPPPSNPGLALVTPTETWVIGGPADAVDPTDLQADYMVQNVSDKVLHWAVELTADWLSLGSASSGSLGPGFSDVVTFHVDAGASQGSAAPLSGSILFLDADDGATLAVRKVVLNPTPCVDCGGAGWTQFSPSPDTRRVYVSSSQGNDANDGLSESTPKRTLAAGKALVRHGFPDWMLLRRGDVWEESLQRWTAGGRSPTEPALVGTYGSSTARPQLRTGKLGGVWTDGGTGSPDSIDHLAIVGLHFRATGFDGIGNQVGANMLLPSRNVLIEDCMFEGYSTNVVFQGFDGRHKDFKLRRCVVVDAWNVKDTGASPQGFYAYAVDGLLIEENVFDHNGWNESVAGAGADAFSHNVYIDNDNTSVVARGNILANGSSHGMQMRSGGLATDNLFVRNAIALSLGGGNDPEPAGVSAEVHDNVILDGRNINASHPRGWGLIVANISHGHINGNIVANNTQGTQPVAIGLDGDHHGDFGPDNGVHEIDLAGNVIYDWGGNLDVSGGGTQVTGIGLFDNDIQDHAHDHHLIEHFSPDSVAAITSGGNRFHCGALPSTAWFAVGSSLYPLSTWKGLVGDGTSSEVPVAYVDPTRSPAKYNAHLGGANSLAAFLVEVRKQSSTNWRPQYAAPQVNAWLRGGFAPAP